MISLKCEDCLGTMEIDESRTIISCPYCGSKKIIPESDAVKIEKIKSEKHLKMMEMMQQNSKEWWEKTRKDNQEWIDKENRSYLIAFICFFIFMFILMFMIKVMF